MAPSYPQTGKLASAVRTKGGFVKKPQSPNLGDNLNTASSDDDKDLPHIGRTSGTNPEDPKNLHGGTIPLEPMCQHDLSVISIPGHRLPFPPIPLVYLCSFLTNLGAPVFRNPLGTPRWSPPPPFNLLPMPP
ncbi:uncharacterized protein EI90DRAFT_3131010 [Cantharellus anzutake]|uniref:uncharacterized protein n=1 Tax=Cantharellus anzutake TaxID=1750568 RepID=UPI001908931F|nr:uncharacterized protein EI90DRAFT_3131010 [Cantharellus anzutake]KAF8322413.1 hypothetical protein EI90DRAFT_3131010 [Cantharellus anzutake]